MGVSLIRIAFIGAIEVFLIGLAVFIFRSGNRDLKNQKVLLIEGFMAFTLCFYWIIPSPSKPCRTSSGCICGRHRPHEDDDDGRRDVLFHQAERAKRIQRIFEWACLDLPTTSLLLLPLFSLGGIPGLIGTWPTSTWNLVRVLGTPYGTDLGYTPVCPDTCSIYLPFSPTPVRVQALPIVLVLPSPCCSSQLHGALSRNPACGGKRMQS